MAVMTRGRAAPAAAAKPAAKAAAKPRPKAKAAVKPVAKKPPMPKMTPTDVDGILSSPIAGPKMGGADLGGGFTPPAPARGAPPPPVRKPAPPPVRGGRPF